MAKALIIVDMQNDFVDGSLGTKEAVAIVPSVCKKIQDAKEDGALIFATKDTHSSNYLDTREGQFLPVPHRNSAGQRSAASFSHPDKH